MAYRVPRRFISPPEEPPPYGLFALSLVGHVLFFFTAMVVSAYVSAQIDQSKVYVVNLVPTPPAAGSPTPRVAERAPAPERPVKVPERTPPKPAPERTEPPPKPKAETPPPRPEKAPEPPPLPKTPPREIARVAAPRPDEFTLPRRAEKETPVLDTGATRERLTPPPRPVAPPPAPATPPPVRAPEAPRVAAPQAPPPAPVPATVVAVKPGVEPIRLGRPDSTVPATGSIALDVADFPFTYYLRQIQAKISERWSPPRTTAAGGERAIIFFEIGRDGQIKEPKLERESGNALYDQSALRAVMEASPFPPLPPEFKAPSLRVHFGFEFRPEQG